MVPIARQTRICIEPMNACCHMQTHPSSSLRPVVRLNLVLAWTALTISCLVPLPSARAAEGFRLDDRSAIFEAGPDKALDLTDEVTLEAWVKADRMDSGGGRILDKSVPGTQQGYMLDTWPGNSLRLLNAKGFCRFDAQSEGGPVDSCCRGLQRVETDHEALLQRQGSGQRRRRRVPAHDPQPRAPARRLRPRGGQPFQRPDPARRRVSAGAHCGGNCAARRGNRPGPNPKPLQGVLGEWEFFEPSRAGPIAPGGRQARPEAGGIKHRVRWRVRRPGAAAGGTADPLVPAPGRQVGDRRPCRSATAAWPPWSSAASPASASSSTKNRSGTVCSATPPIPKRWRCCRRCGVCSSKGRTPKPPGWREK